MWIENSVSEEWQPLDQLPTERTTWHWSLPYFMPNESPFIAELSEVIYLSLSTSTTLLFFYFYSLRSLIFERQLT
jgi:hypothetical protein